MEEGRKYGRLGTLIYPTMSQNVVLKFTYTSHAKGTEDDRMFVEQSEWNSFGAESSTISDYEHDDEWSVCGVKGEEEGPFPLAQPFFSTSKNGYVIAKWLALP